MLGSLSGTDVPDSRESGNIAERRATDRGNDLDDGDVKFHTDFRSIYAALLEKWLGWPAAPILGDMWKPAECLA